MNVLEEKRPVLQTEAAEGQRTKGQPEKIWMVLEQELPFQNSIRSALVTTILDKIVLKKDSTKEVLYL